MTKGRYLTNKIKQFAERLALKGADVVIHTTVHCARLSEKYKGRSLLIDNGFDERLIPAAIEKFAPRGLIYTGKLTKQRKLEPLIEAVKKIGVLDLGITYFGQDYRDLKLYEGPLFSANAPKDYSEICQEIEKSWLTIVLSSGEPLESTTKIFDYISRRRPVLVVEAKVSTEGAIRDVAKEYPAVFFCKNTPDSIIDALNKLNRERYRIEKTLGELSDDYLMKFSREHGYLALKSGLGF
ncbi:hypothetical protein N9V92_06760 [Luminiphilus sp.]|nr:hypothetical protein [Luminiphilus sp.]